MRASEKERTSTRLSAGSMHLHAPQNGHWSSVKTVVETHDLLPKAPSYDFATKRENAKGEDAVEKARRVGARSDAFSTPVMSCSECCREASVLTWFTASSFCRHSHSSCQHNASLGCRATKGSVAPQDLATWRASGGSALRSRLLAQRVTTHFHDLIIKTTTLCTREKALQRSVSSWKRKA